MSVDDAPEVVDPVKEMAMAALLSYGEQCVRERFPHADGDVTVLGPDIFASTEGPGPDTVISWRGENFVLQTPPEVRAEEPTVVLTYPEAEALGDHVLGEDAQTSLLDAALTKIADVKQRVMDGEFEAQG